MKAIDLKFSKLPPQALDIEEAVIGAILLESNVLTICASRMNAEMFYAEQNSLIYSAILKLYDANLPVDLLTVTEQLKKEGNLQKCGGAYGLSKKTNAVTSSANIENHILLISEKFLARETIKICTETLSKSYDETYDVWDTISTLDSNVQKMQEKVIVGMVKDVSFYGQKVLEQHANTKLTGVLGTPTGIEPIDRIICGLVEPDLIIIAARPGQGKTALALSITYNITIQNQIPGAWFSLEMDGTQLVRRLASIDTGICHSNIREGKTTNDQDMMLGESVERIGRCPLYINDSANTNVRDIRTRATLLKKRHGIKYIVVDYLQLMSGVDAKGKSREQIVSEISRTLKVIAKELELPVIALSQLSREVEKRPDKMPQLSDLRESGGIEQDADNVMFLMRPETYGMTEDVDIKKVSYSVRGLTIANFAKTRHGETQHAALNFNGPTMYFSTIQQNQVDNFIPSQGIKKYYDSEEAPF